MINWVKGASQGPHSLLVADQVYQLPRIPTHLQLHTDAGDARALAANAEGTAMGVIFGCDAFLVTEASKLPFNSLRASGVVRPVAAGTAMLTDKLGASDFCVYLGDCQKQKDARARGRDAMKFLRREVFPRIEAVESKYPGWIDRWWQPLRPQSGFFRSVWKMKRYIACASPQARPIFAFLSTQFVPNNTLQVFAFEDDYSFGIIQSLAHWAWTKAKGGKVRADIRYTNAVWSTFPWPQEPAEAAVTAVAAAARDLRALRASIMAANGWTLRALYRAAEVSTHPLNAAQGALDEAVATAYGMPVDQEPTEYLLDLNRVLSEDEARAIAVRGPGLPAELSRLDPRWSSLDCIEPPPLKE
jgi:hypothetical protein